MDKNAKESNSLDESSRHEFKILLVEGQRERERERESEREREKCAERRGRRKYQSVSSTFITKHAEI